MTKTEFINLVKTKTSSTHAKWIATQIYDALTAEGFVIAPTLDEQNSAKK